MLVAFGWLLDAVTKLFPTVLFDPTDILQLAIAGVIILVTSAIYYLFFWTLAGQTPGKMLLGLRVVSAGRLHGSHFGKHCGVSPATFFRPGSYMRVIGGYY